MLFVMMLSFCCELLEVLFLFAASRSSLFRKGAFVKVFVSFLFVFVRVMRILFSIKCFVGELL